MEHIAIDLGGRESQICIRSEDQTILKERRYPTSWLSRYLQRRPESRVILETSAEAFAIADAAAACGHDVRVVPATLVRSLGIGARGIKTDQRDARILSEVSCRVELPSVHVPSRVNREIQAMCGMREALVEARTKLINNVRGYLRTKVIRLRTGTTQTFPFRVRKKLLSTPEGLSMAVERQLICIEALSEQIAAATKELTSVAKENEICARLMTVPGVGPVTALRFYTALDDVTRFPSAHQAESYLGITPGESSSSERRHRTSITKAGPAKVRWSLSQACWCAWRLRPNDPLVLWAKQVAQRRGRAIAIVAMMRKLAGILYAMWRDGTNYQPLLAATKVKPEQGVT